MRLFLVAAFLLLYSIFTVPMCMIQWIVGKKNPEKRAVIAQKCVVVSFKIILFISGVKVTVKGKENILHDRAALYTYNHRGYFDILVGYTTAPMRTAYVSKKEIQKVPMISWWMKCMNCLFLDRNDIRQGMETIKDGIELLKNGTSVYIAPEGTRNTGEGLLEFHDASFKLADKSHSPVVPVAINNTDEVFEKHLPWIRSQHVIIEYCSPIYTENMDRKERKQISDMVRQVILEKIQQNAKEI